MYKRMGFSMTGDRVLDDPDESPEWGFELALNDGRQIVDIERDLKS
jgi:hypothetical protein